MKHKFAALRIRMILRVLLYSLLAFVVGLVVLYLFIDGVFQEPFARLMVFIFQVFGLNEEGAINFYHTVIRDNKSTFLFLGFIFLLFLFFYMALSKFTKYLNQISQNVQAVFEESEMRISLPSELGPMEQQLSDIKNNLAVRKMQARESEQRKNDLVVYLAHDLKTPLTSVIGYLNLLQDEQDISPQLRGKYLKISLDKALRLEDLINEFFDITRYNLQEVDLKYQKLDLTMMLAQVADEFYPLFQEKGIFCEPQLEQGIIFYGDGDKLARVFDNLLKNAVNYSYEHSQIRLEMKTEQQQVVIRVQNQGDEIPPHQLSSIFEKFYRLDGARTSRTGGAGLGLAIAKQIVTLHGGTIEAQSSREETVFTVRLPLQS